MKAFGEDVQAVTEATNSPSVILIGHSMGGSVIAEAARLMPKRVIGIVGVDTLDNIEYPLTREELDQMLAPLKSDFQAGSRQFVKEMISSETNPLTREWILSGGYFISTTCCCFECNERDDDAVYYRGSG